jgi:hypothetical protein
MSAAAATETEIIVKALAASASLVM